VLGFGPSIICREEIRCGWAACEGDLSRAICAKVEGGGSVCDWVWWRTPLDHYVKDVCTTVIEYGRIVQLNMRGHQLDEG